MKRGRGAPSSTACECLARARPHADMLARAHLGALCSLPLADARTRAPLLYVSAGTGEAAAACSAPSASSAR